MEASSSAAAAAIAMNPHLHPAFMSAFMPNAAPTAASTAVASLNPQLQMLAGAYAASPMQLAAYEELLRNGYSSFLQGAGSSVGPSAPKVTKKN